MKFTVEIQCDNEAFQDDKQTEVARILSYLIGRLESGAASGHLRDTNGNTVGTFSFEGE
jgi:hypothetical protein